MMATPENCHVVLINRPGENSEPQASNFSCTKTEYPTQTLKNGEILIKNRYLSLDPALRCLMNADSGVEYIKAWALGETISGLGGVGEVVASGSSDFNPGDLITPNLTWPWKQYFVIETSAIRKIPYEVSQISPTLPLSVLGVTGLTAYLGVKEKGHVAKGANQTMVVSAAAGSTGSLAGQIGKSEGCGKLIGICGSEAKCLWITSELGFDAAINYKTEDVPARLKNLCPDGVDVYFDNVGGQISDQVIDKMNTDSHIILCGQIAVYNKDLPYPPPLPPATETIIEERAITRERFMVLNYQDKFETAFADLMKLHLSGKLKVKETVEDGLHNAGKGFVSMMKGGNIGKQLVKL